MDRRKKQEIVETAKKLGLVPGSIFRYTDATLPNHYLVLSLSDEAEILPHWMNFNGEKRAACRCTVQNISRPERHIFDMSLMFVQEGETWHFSNIEFITDRVHNKMKCLSLDEMVGEILVVDTEAEFINFSNLDGGESMWLPNGTPLVIYSWRPQGQSVIVNLLDLSHHRKMFSTFHDQDFAVLWIGFNTKIQRGVQ